MSNAAIPAAIELAGAAQSSANAAALATPAPFHACVQNFLDQADTPRAYLERCIARIEKHEPAIRAFVHLDLDTARRLADEAGERYRQRRPLSPVDGMPVGVKDIIDTRDMPTQMNSPLFAGFRPRRDAACVMALKQAGAIVLGKTVTTEFACGRSGPTRNPHDSLRTPGGSSSGSAAAVAAGMLPAALGTQTQASIIRPASYCGIVGYKPSIGTLCYDGIGRLAPTLDQLGVLAGDLGDAQAVAAAIAAVGPDYGGPVLRLGAQAGNGVPLRRLARLDTEGWAELDSAAREIFEQTMAGLVAAGVDMIDRSDPSIARIEALLAQISASALHIFAWEAQWPLRTYLDCGAALVGERVQELVQLASEMRADDYADAVARRAALRAEVAALAGTVDAFVTASSSGAAPLGLDNTGSRTFSVPWTLVGGPALSLPVQQIGGLPFGLQLMGLPGRDSELFGFAQWIMTQWRGTQ
ncbi:amidase [Lacisediminimonas sp.]|uniref:amidase n=1 Tax=Lacisediminimonas sp. TaxID=3060582 RepID=UPI002720E365|nr:amidase [Lacisediminimonas sp.]MDO8299428.1 amidase [Lacisediminimonas sp.]MDO9218084.1 amidase [Lacisediminimonas sp.]